MLPLADATPVIEIRNLHKAYGALEVIKGVDITAHKGDVVSLIRQEAPGIEIGVPTGRWIQPDPKDRVETVLSWGRLGSGKPDVCGVNVHELGWTEVCHAAWSVGIAVELGVWTSGDAVTLRQNGLPPVTRRVIAESTVIDPETAVAEVIRILRALGQPPVPVLLHGEEEGAWPVLEYATRVNIDTRIGFEDVLVRPDGHVAWRGDALPDDAAALIDLVRGARPNTKDQ